MAMGLKRSIPIVGVDVLRGLNSDVDFAFVDGDHSICCTMADFLFLKDFLALGGVTVFHDAYSWPSVSRALYIMLNDIYYCIRGTSAYFSLDTWHGIDGLASFERVANETCPTLRIRVVESDSGSPVSGASVHVPSAGFNTLTPADGSVYVFTEVQAGSTLEVTHPHYAPYKSLLEKGTDGDFVEFTAILSP